MQGELLQLFPIPVGKLKGRATSEQENYILNTYLKEMKQNAGNKITINKNVLDDIGLQDLKTHLTQIVNQYYNMVYRPEQPINLYITTSWCNVSRRGDFHHQHIHYNSLLSATFYLQAETSDSIIFKRDERDTLPLFTMPNKNEFNPFNTASYTMNVEQYDVAVFPSTLAHFVEPLNREGERVSLSFNTFATGNLGSLDNLSQLTLR